MAIITEYYKTRNDGIILNRTYSDTGYLIERDGVRYFEAIDPAELDRKYTETDEFIETIDVLSEIEEKAAAYDILMGVS